MVCLLLFTVPPPINVMSFPSHHIRNKPQGLSLSKHHYTQPKNDYSSVLKLRLAGIPKSCAASGIELGGGLDPALMPKHVAIIMDGHRRWAKSKGVALLDGYEKGTRNLKKLATQFAIHGVEIVTIFNFHPGAWNRPKEDVDIFLKLADDIIQENIEEVMRFDVRVTGVGDRSRFPRSLQDLIHSVEERAKDNKGPHLVLAANYSGRYDITQAAKKIASKVKDGVLDVEDVDETLFEQHLQTNGLEFPCPDLLIRTGGKFKLSNFMLWQMAYTEIYVSDKLFPDFNEEDVVEALTEYQRRQRRFGAN